VKRVIVTLVLWLAAPGVAAAATGILAVGDFGSGGTPQQELGIAMRSFEAERPAEAIVALGDNDYTESPSRFEQNWAASFGWLPTARVAVSGVLGNHDLGYGDGGRYELATLGMPRFYYSRRIGDVELFLLDSNRVTAGQTRWLGRALAASKARWRIAAFHHPPYTCGGHEGAEDVERSWVPLFERYGVQLVLSGHDHNYQRFAPRRGVTYVVHGGGNANLYSLKPCPKQGYPSRRAAAMQRGFLYLAAARTRLVVSAVDLAGRTIDRTVVYP
jgi:tartrate-resistant acid phosphatase type 5